MNQSSILDMAYWFLEWGFSIIPLEPKGKRPIIKWQEFQKRKPTKAEILEWFEHRENNIGIVTGSISGITVLDCDSTEAEALARKMGLPTTLTVKTGRGRHFYFKYEPGTRNFQKRDDLPGIDLRSDGGYVVAPPSVHPNGSTYEFEENE